MSLYIENCSVCCIKLCFLGRCIFSLSIYWYFCYIAITLDQGKTQHCQEDHLSECEISVFRYMNSPNTFSINIAFTILKKENACLMFNMFCHNFHFIETSPILRSHWSQAKLISARKIIALKGNSMLVRWKRNIFF